MKQIKKTLKIKIGEEKLNVISKIIFITITIFITCFISISIQKNERESIKINEKELKSENGKIVVYFSGAINSPGIYNFEEGIRLEEALDIIGGIKYEADISKVNLVKILYDSEKIVIPYIQKELEDVENTENESKSADDSQKININTADESELILLPGIGEATAKKIIEYRKNGNFELLEDIKKVPGIGEIKFNQIKDKITTE